MQRKMIRWGIEVVSMAMAIAVLQHPFGKGASMATRFNGYGCGCGYTRYDGYDATCFNGHGYKCASTLIWLAKQC